MKIATKLRIGFFSLSFLTAISVFYFFWKEIRPQVYRAVENTLQDFSTVLAATVAADTQAGVTIGIPTPKQKTNLNQLSVRLSSVRLSNLFSTLTHPLVSDKDTLPLHIYVTDERGIILYDNQDTKKIGADFSKWNDIHLTLRGEYGARATRKISDDWLSSVHYVAAPVKINDKTIGVVSVGKAVESFSGFLQNSQQRMLFILLLVLVLAYIFGSVLAYSISSPLANLAKFIQDSAVESAVESAEKSTLESGVDSRSRLQFGSDEVGLVGKAFCEIQEKLVTKEYIEKYVHNLTHEIKSPLSAIVGAAELLSSPKLPETQVKKLLKNISIESNRLQDISDRILELASLENRQSNDLQFELFDFEMLVEEVIDALSPLAARLDIVFETNFSPGANREENTHLQKSRFLRGERFLVWGAVCNLIKNALEFSPSPSKITIDIQADSKELNFSVRDHGPGIPEYALARVFDKFFSLERPLTGRRSSGLGLSFVAEVARIHSGEIKIQNHPEGGAMAQLRFQVLS